MQSQRVISLTDEQVKTTLYHWFDVLELEDVKEIVAESHPTFTKEDMKKYQLKLVTNFGDYYWVYRGVHKTTKKPYFFCIVKANKFVALNLRACSAYYKLFKDEIDKVNGYDFKAVCQVFVCTTYTMAEGVRTHVAPDIFPCLYRFIPLPDLYVLIGSKTPNSLFGLAYDYKIERNVPNKHSNGLEYATILDADVVARMLNANEGDIITHKRILWESGTAYSEIYRRCVKRTHAKLSSVLPDGKCFGHVYNEKTSDEADDEEAKDEDEGNEEIVPEEQNYDDSSDSDEMGEYVENDDDSEDDNDDDSEDDDDD